MSSRPGQWELLGISKDPVPADRADVDRVARDFETNSTIMTSAARALERIAGGSGWTGEAAKSFAGEADEAYGDLGKAASKYTDAAEALRTYAGHVETAREETGKALQEAEQAESDRLSNKTSSLEGVDDPTDAQKDADDRRQERHDGAVSALGDARTRLNHAMETLETRASQCSNDIKDASENFKDSRMDDIKGAVASVLKVLVNALSIIAVVLAVVIVILLVFTSLVIGPLLLAALILGGVIFALTAVQVAMGDATLTDLAWASLGLIGGGFGRLAGSSAKVLTAAARTSLIAKSGRQAVRALPLASRFGRFVPFAPITRAMSNSARGTAAFAAMRTTTRTIDQKVFVDPLLRGMNLSGAVNDYAAIAAMRGMNPGVINSIRLNAANLSTHGVVAGSTLETASNLHNLQVVGGNADGLDSGLAELPGSWGDMTDGQPDRTIDVPDLPPPLPSHMAPAGR